MSDGKWRKFFQLSVEHVDSVATGVWKLVDEEKPVEANLPVSLGDVWDSAVDGCLNGPVSYNMIEWLRIPRIIWYRRYANAPLSSRVQGIEAISTALSKIGKFPVEETSEALLLRGYSCVA